MPCYNTGAVNFHTLGRLFVKSYHTLLVVLIAMMTLFPSPATVQANTLAGAPVLFSETGHTLGYNFRTFFDNQGGLPILGYPLTEVFLENGLPVQYFERARLEWHASVGTVEAGHLGHWAAQGHAHLPAFQSLAAGPSGAQFFAQTGHSLDGVFLRFWQERGGLKTFGYPISEEFPEQNPQDGQTYTVQYFERARFEFHPEQPAPHQVLLGHLGRQYLTAYPAPESALQPVASADQAWATVRPARVSIPRIGVHTDVIEAGFSFGEWDVPRYGAAHYWPVSAYPGTGGNTIIAGHVGYRDTIFNYLPNVQVGDDVFVNVGGQDRRYIVREVLTLVPQDTWVMGQTDSEVLTLITCIPIGVYSHRLIVRAEPVI